MRLRNVQVVLREHIGKLKAQTRELPGPRFDIMNRATLKLALVAIRSVRALEESVDMILAYPPFQNESTVVDQNELNMINSYTQTLVDRSEAILRLLDSTLPPEAESYFFIKFPKGAEHLDGLKDFIQEIHLGLDQPIRLLGHAPLRITTGEPGSLVTEMVVVGPLAMLAVGMILRLAVRALKLEQEHEKTLQEHEKTLQEIERTDQAKEKTLQEGETTAQSQLKTDLLRLEKRLKLIEVRKEELALERDASLEGLADGKADVLTALNEGVTQTERLLKKGTEFQLQLDAPPEIKKEFPPEAICADPALTPKVLDATARNLLAGLDSDERAPTAKGEDQS